MGAVFIEDGGYGASMAEVYNKLCADALHYSGHDPYNGTISTSSGYIDMSRKFNALLGDKRKTGKHIRTCYDKIYEEAEDKTQKWEDFWGVEIPNSKSKSKKRRKFMFMGWAAE